MPTPLNNETLQEIRTLAGLFYTPKEVCMMLDLDKKTFAAGLINDDSEIYNAFYGGRLQADMKFREKVIALANLGSSPAQTLVAKLIESSQIKMNNR